MIIFCLRKRPEYHLVTAASSCTPNGAPASEYHGCSNTWIVMNLYARTVHICLALAVTFCPTINGMSHPRRREVAWCLCLHGLFTWSRVNAHFPRRFAETSRRDAAPRNVWRRCVSVQRFASSVKAFVRIFSVRGNLLTAHEFVVACVRYARMHARGRNFADQNFIFLYSTLRLHCTHLRMSLLRWQRTTVSVRDTRRLKRWKKRLVINVR